MDKNIYIFSGLGADDRVFQRLEFESDIITFIKWTIPQNNESIEAYVTILLDQITTIRPILIGLSFGGIIAVEVAKQIETDKVILIASCKTEKEIPIYFRLAGKLSLHKLLPIRQLKKANFISNWLFGTTSAFENQLLKTILSDTDPIFLEWAIDKVVNWTNKVQLKNIKHIHGTADRILPFRFVTCDFKIEGGGHFMTLNKTEEIMKHIKEIID